ncbi:MAG: thiamine phosphate synthase [Clostridia bacterium]|nr:thiamine phosphate synthase [Clostridia bacterium]
MNRILRILDANINRASEGIRVLEDVARFYFNDKNLSEELKKLRHSVRKEIGELSSECLKERDAVKDVGIAISQELRMDNKSSLSELIPANFKRVQESLRTIEENLKIAGKYELSKLYESYRFSSYSLEKDFAGKCMSENKVRKLETDLYCLTAEEYSNGRSNIEVVKALICAGIKIIQYREKDKKLKDKYNECLKIRQMTKDAGVTFIINDNTDIALMIEADGVHIGQDDLPIERVRELVGEEMIIGLSTHSPEQAIDAVKRGADYIGVGPLYRTFTKKDVCEPVGLEYLDYAVKNIKIPFVAIGGIKEHNVREVSERGAGLIAMVTEIVGAGDIVKKIESVRKTISKEHT